MITLRKQHRRYDKYQDANVQWLNVIPREWKMARNQSQFSVAKDIVYENSGDFLLLSLTLKGIIPRNIESGKGKFPTNFDSYQKVQKEDLIFCLFDIDETPRTIGLSTLDGMVTGAYTVVRCHKDVCAKYIYYYYLALDFQKRLRPLYTGLRKVIRPNTFLHAKMPVPSVKEQSAIASYLDEKCALIDSIIAKKKRQMKLLKEKRSAIINRAVTRGLPTEARAQAGLDDNVEMKESGVEWIGEIPRRWEIKRLKHLAQVKASNIDKNIREEERGVRLCNYTDVYNNEFVTSAITFMKNTASSDQINKLSIEQGDILITKDSESADDIGVPAMISENIHNLVCGYHLYLISKKANLLHSEYLLRFLQSKFLKAFFETRAKGVTRFGIDAYSVKNADILVPPVKEQRKIAEHIKVNCTKADRLIILIERSISILTEYKTSLIAHAVTGKIKIT